MPNLPIDYQNSKFKLLVGSQAGRGLRSYIKYSLVPNRKTKQEEVENNIERGQSESKAVRNVIFSKL